MEALVKIITRMLSELAGRDTSPDSEEQLEKFAYELFLYGVVDGYSMYEYITKSQSVADANMEPVPIEFGLPLYIQALEYGMIRRFNKSADTNMHLDTKTMQQHQLSINALYQYFVDEYDAEYITREMSLEMMYHGLILLESTSIYNLCELLVVDTNNVWI